MVNAVFGFDRPVALGAQLIVFAAAATRSTQICKRPTRGWQEKSRKQTFVFRKRFAVASRALDHDRFRAIGLLYNQRIAVFPKLLIREQITRLKRLVELALVNLRALVFLAHPLGDHEQRLVSGARCRQRKLLFAYSAHGACECRRVAGLCLRAIEERFLFGERHTAGERLVDRVLQEFLIQLV